MKSHLKTQENVTGAPELAQDRSGNENAWLSDKVVVPNQKSLHYFNIKIDGESPASGRASYLGLKN